MSSRAPLLVLSLLAACGGAPPDAETPAVAETPPVVTTAPAAAPVAAPVAAPAGLDLRCTSAEASLEVSGATLVLASEAPHRTSHRWNPIAGTFRFTAGAIAREGRLEGVRNADYAFIMSGSDAKVMDISEVELTGGAADGHGFILAWTTGTMTKTDTGHETPGRSSASVTCTGSLLTAQPTE
jgi:hypothetical protein